MTRLTSIDVPPAPPPAPVIVGPGGDGAHLVVRVAGSDPDGRFVAHEIDVPLPADVAVLGRVDLSYVPSWYGASDRPWYLGHMTFGVGLSR